MADDVLKEGKEKMESVIRATQTAYGNIRTGRANPRLLDRISVNYYDTPTPLNQLANVSAPEPRLLMVQPWDKSVLKDIEKAILASDLGLTPNSDGTVIRLSIPQLTEETRKNLVKVVHQEAEDHKVAIRNIRRDLNDSVKKDEKASEISQDESRRLQEEIQELTDNYIAQIDTLTEKKEEEILEI